MARQSEGPWFRAIKGTWFATFNERKVSLRVRGKENKAEVVKAWHRLMADGLPEPPKTEPPIEAPKPKNEPTVKELLEAFLDARKPLVKADTLTGYRNILKRSTLAFGDRKAASMKPLDILRWLNTVPVSQSTRSDVARVLMTAFKWAEAEGIIPLNPLKNLKRPHGESRGTKAVVSANDHKKLLKAANPSPRLLLTLLHETGARPAELSRLTAEDADLTNGVAVLAQHKTASKTGKPRLIILTPKAVGILRKQAAVNPKGPLLRNSKGMPWTKDGIGRAIRLARKRAKVEAIAYGYRHTFATDALAKGVPDATVAALLGHSSTTMLHKHYSHLTARADVLRKAASMVR